MAYGGKWTLLWPLKFEESINLLQSAVKRSFTHKAPQIWNTLPTNIRESDSLSSFKKCLKTHLFADYC